jgi:hypothetical protein
VYPRVEAGHRAANPPGYLIGFTVSRGKAAETGVIAGPGRLLRLTPAVLG